MWVCSYTCICHNISKISSHARILFTALYFSFMFMCPVFCKKNNPIVKESVHYHVSNNFVAQCNCCDQKKKIMKDLDVKKVCVYIALTIIVITDIWACLPHLLISLYLTVNVLPTDSLKG